MMVFSGVLLFLCGPMHVCVFFGFSGFTGIWLFWEVIVALCGCLFVSDVYICIVDV